MSQTPAGIGDIAPVARLAEQKAWNWYDWANSAYFTTINTAFFGPWMIHVARQASTNCGASDSNCVDTVAVLGMNLAAGSLPGYLTALATVISALLLPVVGAVIDRSSRKKLHLTSYAYSGAAFAALLFFLDSGRWQIGALAIVMSSILMGCSLVAYNAILVDISTEDERDRVSSRGWAWGYLGGFILLAVNFVFYLQHDTFGMSEGLAVRLSMLSAAIWWALFTLIPAARLKNHPASNTEQVEGGVIAGSFGQLWNTLKDLKNYPMTLTFLLAYLFYNDGIQTVIGQAATYGSEQLGLDQSVLNGTILLIQIVAFGGALIFGKLAANHGAYKSICIGVVGWMGVVVLAFFLPANNAVFFMVLGVAVAIVMGGTQALSRSFFSLFIPRGREGEYFSLYQMMERGTSWLGTLAFSLTYQLTGSYRPSILALIVFFALGLFFLLRLDVQRGIAEAGNARPATV